MRKQEMEITDFARIEGIIRQCKVCRLGLCLNGRTYIVPMNFGYQNRGLYFHSARSGRKIDILQANPEVCFEMDMDFGIKRGDIACRWGARYISVIGYGKAAFVQDPEAKRAALDIIMGHYSSESFDYPDASLANTAVFKIAIDEISAKESG